MVAVFITGTDTDVGKTFVGACLLREARRRGLTTAGLKPMESGVEDMLHPADASELWSAAGRAGPVPIDACRYRYPQPVAPGVAADLTGDRIDLAAMVCDVASFEHDFVVVEGAGGLLVPIGQGRLLLDFIRELKLPTLIVARAGLGTINHTLLTANTLRQASVPIIGAVLNQAEDLELATSNAHQIASYGTPVLAVWPSDHNALRHSELPQRLLQAILQFDAG